MTLSLHNRSLHLDRLLPKPATFNQQADIEVQRISEHGFPGSVLVNNGRQRNDNAASMKSQSVANVESEAIHGHPGRRRLPGYPNSRGRLRDNMNIPEMAVDDGTRSSSPSENDNPEGGQYCLCQPEPKIPRPRNAFILFRQHQHAGVVARNPGLPNPEISKIIGEQWRRLTEKAKEDWKALAEEEKTRHSQQYPDYRYKPKRNSRFGSQPSASDLASVMNEPHSACQKCGGRTMNPPTIPYVPQTPIGINSTQTTSHLNNSERSYNVMQEQQLRTFQGQPVASPPYSARARPYSEFLDQPAQSRYDHRLQFTRLQPPTSVDMNISMAESPDAKRRRFDTNGKYLSNRNTYPNQQSHIRGTMQSRLTTDQHQRPQAGQLPQLSRSLTQPIQHRRNQSLTLPPLHTPTMMPREDSHAKSSQTQKSGIEAMIMSIPVLNKIKILSQVAPALALPGPNTHVPEPRGAIIAVEGMNWSNVSAMTTALAEHLEKEGNFVVRIFGGPDPLAMERAQSNSSSAEGSKSLTFSTFLKLIHEWHSISDEMIDYVTTKPGSEDMRLGVRDLPTSVPIHSNLRMTNAIGSQASDLPMNSQMTSDKTPISSVSPKTIAQTADLSLRSPPVKPASSVTDTISSPPRTRSRIPAAAAALVMQNQSKTDALEDHNKDNRVEPQQPNADEAMHSQAQKSAGLPESQVVVQSEPLRLATADTIFKKVQEHHNPTVTPIPIAIVPHYQLTTVNVSSINMPITDAYSPHSHWQWLATLWRGCVGPDITIAIKEYDDDGDAACDSGISANGSSMVPPGSARAQPPNHSHQPHGPRKPSITTGARTPAVDIRLADCKTIVVRTGTDSPPGTRFSSTTNESTRSGVDPSAIEAWEKAKRRVGFEVEEYLRK